MSTLAIRTNHRDHASTAYEGAAARPRTGALAAIRRGLAAWQVRRQTRKVLYGMQPRLLRDIGVDPAEIYDQYHGTIGELPGDRFRGLPVSRWGSRR